MKRGVGEGWWHREILSQTKKREGGRDGETENKRKGRSLFQQMINGSRWSGLGIKDPAARCVGNIQTGQGPEFVLKMTELKRICSVGRPEDRLGDMGSQASWAQAEVMVPA